MERRPPLIFPRNYFGYRLDGAATERSRALRCVTPSLKSGMVWRGQISLDLEASFIVVDPIQSNSPVRQTVLSAALETIIIPVT